jgi:hypothetical protein
MTKTMTAISKDYNNNGLHDNGRHWQLQLVTKKIDYNDNQNDYNSNKKKLR